MKTQTKVKTIKKLPDKIADNTTGADCMIPFCTSTTMFASARCHWHKNYITAPPEYATTQHPKKKIKYKTKKKIRKLKRSLSP